MMSWQALLLAIAIGFIAGLRSMTAIAAVSWAAHLHWIDLSHSKLAFLGSASAAYILSVLAIAEIVMDKLPKTPNRTAIGPLAGRIVAGGLSGAAICAGAKGSLLLGALLGILGALGGTFAGFHFRRWLTAMLKSPLVSAIIEDVIAVGGAFLIVSCLK